MRNPIAFVTRGVGRFVLVALLSTLGAAVVSPLRSNAEEAETAAFKTATDEDAGARLARDVYERPDGESVAAHARMTLRSKRSRDRVREFYTYRRDFPDGEIRSLTRFVAPANVADTGLLVHSHVADDDDQWLYLPALKRTRRISSENRGGRFVQSGIYYEDLQDRLPEEDVHRVQGEGEYQGVPVKILESTPVDPDNSAYTRRVSWIHPDLLIPLRIDYFQRGEEPVKRLEVRRVDKVEGYWTVTESVITHLASGDETIIVNLATHYDTGLPEELFGTRALADPRMEAEHRP